MPVTIPERSPATPAPNPLWKRICWFVALYVVGVLAVGILAYGLRLWIKPAAKVAAVTCLETSSLS